MSMNLLKKSFKMILIVILFAKEFLIFVINLLVNHYKSFAQPFFQKNLSSSENTGKNIFPKNN